MEKATDKTDTDWSLNMDFERVACVLTDEQQWITSPADGVSRVPLERVAPESGHTTSFVEFKAGVSFPEHAHPGNEEIVVLHGRFIDEHGEYPAGSWIRSPHMSTHYPRVEEETLILVKVGHLP